MTYAAVLAGLQARLATIAGVAATLTLNPAGNNNALLWTAVSTGFEGNQISVEYTNPGAINKPLTLTLTGNAISIALATNGAGAITSTGDLIKTAVAADAAIAALVTPTDVAPDDGSGVVTAMARAYLTGGVSAPVAILDYVPTAIHDTPMIYSLLDNLEITRSGQIKAKHYRILHRLLLRWQDNELAEEQIIPFVDSVPDAIDADPHLGGALVSGYAEINECDAVWVTVAGVEYRALDFYSTVIDKS
jgi:hypothetical protein